MLEIKNLNKNYDLASGETIHVLKNINFKIDRAKITAIIGPSGSGKSTLSKCLSLLEQPTSGELILDGIILNQLSSEALRLQRKKIGLVFQSSALLKRRTAAENIALPLQFLGVIDQQVKERVQYLLENVQLLDRANHYPCQLSGGQQQRVAIARALALQPQIIIADEATSGLDPDATQSILKLLTELRDELGLSVILITHEMDVVRQIADEVAVLSHGELIENGHVLDLILNPASQIGKKILPLKIPSNLPSNHVVILLTYSSLYGTPLNWLSQLSKHVDIQFDIHASTVEQICDQTVGKIILSISADLYFQYQNIIDQHLSLLKIQSELIHIPEIYNHIFAA
ncbi:MULTISPECIES: methionine ABC transporter ATP-binding protein [unclassified Acinetobacter]|uniref:methionine ABC transporter ATP-binding protein n=1 Tax=unclassified Acinetobacter TaxID=196816 RepID=UPI0029343BF9|nr:MULTISPECIES: methionine ABC transporter ATP-binding protein [unclassified Acinetobacter]WOE32481.1 methionine ABC transporter ATP-binding protein [Acinetobacter sp. SAAs470]WOE37957.1 methionine ABC transporter ATP-binding protein [Acinetobacter sp. SAAs474]